MMTFKTSFLFLTSLILVACDPAKLLVIRADNKQNVSVTIYANKNILPFSDRNDHSKMIVEVPTNDTIKKTFNYGIGVWSDSSIANLAANIDSIIIRNGMATSVLKTKSEMEAYLKKHRSGFAGSVLTIEAKKNKPNKLLYKTGTSWPL